MLHLDQHPTAHFTGRAVAEGSGYRVEGQLHLAGRTAPLAFDVEAGSPYHARFDLRPSRWGIPQFRALLGTIRLRDLSAEGGCLGYRRVSGPAQERVGRGRALLGEPIAEARNPMVTLRCE